MKGIGLTKCSIAIWQTDDCDETAIKVERLGPFDRFALSTDYRQSAISLASLVRKHVEGDYGRLFDENEDQGNIAGVPHDAVHLADYIGANRQDSPLVYTADRLLWIPIGASPQTRALCLLFFISSLRPLARRDCYAYGHRNHVAAVREQSRWMFSPEQITDLCRGDPAMLAADPAAPEGYRMDRFMIPGGVLHPSQSIITTAKDSDDGCGRQRMYIATSAVALSRIGPRDQQPFIVTASVSTDRGLAQRVAISEAVERFALQDWHLDRFVKATYEEIRDVAIDPDSIVRFTSEQIERDRRKQAFDQSAPYYWVEGERATGERCLVLAAQVYSAGSFAAEPVPLYGTSSNGVACHPDPQLAKRGALREVIERHAFSRWWLSGGLIAPHRIDVQDKQSSVLLADIKRRGLRVSITRLDSKYQHVVMVVAFGDASVTVGLAAADLIEEATLRASKEAWLASLAHVEPLMEPECVRTAYDHFRYWADNPAGAAGLWQDTSESPLYDGSEAPMELVKTTCDIRVTFVHLPSVVPTHSVWRCVSEDLIPLNFGYDNEPLGLERVRRTLSSRTPRISANGVVIPHPLG